MQKIHGTMMDAVAPNKEGALPQAGWHFLEAQLPLAWAPLARGLALQLAAAQWLARQSAQALQAGAVLPTLALDPQAQRDGIELASGVADQCRALQAQWLQGLGDLGGELGQLRQANTLSKYLDQEMNLGQQGLALIGTQLTAATRLAENVQNNLAWFFAPRQ
ncbi:hypothetical protein [Pelomonas sp. KK5]|uniref:hypothetical protein n=1 Tax=Pelomonas sp. KK5 TaxID=1855730 RepID=UPI00097BF3C2|nr:hypothetical protein [Pelomonas sp. KK5]